MSFLVLQKNSTDFMVFFFKSNRNNLFCQIKDQITSSFSGFLGCFCSFAIFFKHYCIKSEMKTSIERTGCEKVSC